ncbi:MAG TPA: hypothetical protein VK184_08850 [Nostocaceae cyanobacterium]|nr:hypothetical protein [Nostocaceae cyanobacterium]
MTNESVSLFNPRQQRWLDHFQWANGGTHIIGITACGRETVIIICYQLQITRTPIH